MKRTNKNLQKMLDSVFTIQNKREAMEIEKAVGTGSVLFYIGFGLSVLVNVLLILDKIGWKNVANVVRLRRVYVTDI